MNRKIHVTALSTLGIATALLVLSSFLIKSPSRHIAAFLVLWSGIQSMVSFYGFEWALPKSDKAFFAVFVGDALVRFLVLAVAVYVLFVSHLPFAVPLLSLAGGYLVLSLIQIPFLHRLPA